MTNGWKVTAIVFIIISLLQFMLISWAWNVGTETIEKENECIINVCGNYGSYYFDDYTNVCECYDNGELVYQEYLK